MVVKKKAAKVEAVTVDSTKLDKLRAALSLDGDPGASEIAQNLHDCLSQSDPVQQIQLVKKTGALLERLETSPAPSPLLLTCVETLAVMYTSLQAQNPLSKATASTLNSVPGWLQEHAVARLATCLLDSLDNLGVEHYSHLTDLITACLDRFPIGERCIHALLKEVLQFLQTVLSEYLRINGDLSGRHVAQAELMQSCLAAVKTSMLVIQRCQELICVSPLQDVLGGLVLCQSRILTEDAFVQTVQSTAGMALVLLVRTVLRHGEHAAHMVANLLLCTESDGTAAPRWLQQSCAGLYRSTRPSSVSLFLCHGALAMIPWHTQSLQPEQEKLLLLIPEILLSLDSSVKESSTALVVARVLTLWSSAALDALHMNRDSLTLQPALVGGAMLQSHLLEHVYAHWEHPLDGVRHQTRALFKNLLQLHQTCSGGNDPARDPFVMALTNSLLGLEWDSRGKYGCLACLVEHLGAEHLLGLQPELPGRLFALLGEQTLAPYASDLLEKLFISHRAQLARQGGDDETWEERWHGTWVSPLLDCLCRALPEQTTYVLDYVLPRVLRCNPASLGCMVRALLDAPYSPTGPPGSRGTVGTLMTCLRAARAQGVAPSTEAGLWEGVVPLGLLRRALTHKHEQVRMDALGLVCESHRSTETICQREMELIQHFLPCSLNSQSAGVRQQTVNLMKKLLCRMKDGAQMLQKRQKKEDRVTLQTYQDFLHWLCETLFQALLPGTSFSTCLTSLHLLTVVGELFTFSLADGFALGQYVSPAHAQAVLNCLASNFLEVKQLASALLRTLPPAAVGLQEPERMLSLLRVALQLSSSTKPFDCVTASHLLTLLVHLHGLAERLALCAADQGLHIQRAAAGTASTLEENAMAVVHYLLRCLQCEVSRAEASLLQAASSFPLYGRLHCITVALQQLDMRSVSLTCQWRILVSDLIATSYRMSDVVSPVVQSSSPEGLIPMDTDSETSTTLQQILQEIQPRDTNDYFAEARELDSQRLDGAGDPGESYRVTAQMVLVCSWRSMKEVSMLLGQLCQGLPLEIQETLQDGLVTEEQVEGVGRYFREQLLQSRHRGAFELAYVAFVRLMDTLCRSGSKRLQQLPGLWLTEVLEEVKSSDPSSKLCATRRSAGIPFYIQALLSSEPKSSSCSLLRMTMRELTLLAKPSREAPTDRSSVPQVHALNILRALYRDTRLGENITPFVSDGVQAALLGFTSPVWAVRNSSTLLFSTLITRIFGVKKGKDERSKKNRMTGREFFTRFPDLYPFLLGQLEEAAATVDGDSGQVKLHPSLFLLLLILGRLYPSPMDGSCSPMGLATFIPLIIRCGRSAVYRTREMAARALVPFVLVTDVPATIRTLLEDLPCEAGVRIEQNRTHGTLLQVLHLLQSYQTDSHRPTSARSGGDTCGLVGALQRRLWLATRQNPCLVTRAAFLDLLGSVCGSRSSPAEASEVNGLRKDTLDLLMNSELFTQDDSISASSPGATQYLLSLAQLANSACVQDQKLWGAESRGPQLLGHLLQCPQYEVRELTLDALLKALEQETEDPNRAVTVLHEKTGKNLLGLALAEKHPQCLAKVLQVLSDLPMTSVLPWSTGSLVLSEGEALRWLLALAEDSAHIVDLHCASLTLASRLVVHCTRGGAQVGDMASLALWGELVRRCCGEEQPADVKVTAADILVKATAGLLASTALPLGLKDTLALWRGLFTLLQDEDADVRDGAADFVTAIPAKLPLGRGDSGCLPDDFPSAVSPPVALEMGMKLLCQLLDDWGQVPAGILILTDWLLGDEEVEMQLETPNMDEEFLFEKGDLNLWKEPLKWVRLLHGNICGLLSTPITFGELRDTLDELWTRAKGRAERCQQNLQGLPPLAQFCCTAEHERLVVLNERVKLTLQVLGQCS